MKVKLLFILSIILLFAITFHNNALAQEDTPTPVVIIVTATPAATPIVYDSPLVLPSGNYANIDRTYTYGDIAIVTVLLFQIALFFLGATIYLVKRWMP